MSSDKPPVSWFDFNILQVKNLYNTVHEEVLIKETGEKEEQSSRGISTSVRKTVRMLLNKIQ